MTKDRVVSFAELRKRPVDGFSAGLVDDDNLMEWDIMIIGYVILATFRAFCGTWQ
jgi:ubiquitin-protein ligase